MADLLSIVVASGCLSLFMLASLGAAPLARTSWTGIRGFALLVTYFTLGPVAAGGVALLGVGVVIARCAPEERGAALRRMLPAGLLALVAAVLSAWLAGVPPIGDLTPESALALTFALLIGYGVGHLADARLTGSLTLTPRALLFAIIQIGIILVVLPATLQVGYGLLLVVLGLLALMVWVWQDASRAQPLRSGPTACIDLLQAAESLDVDGILGNLYAQLSRSLDETGFYAALYDETRGQLSFRLVMLNGQIAEPLPTLSGGVAESVVGQHHVPQHLLSRDDSHSPLAWLPPWPFREYAGVPLRAGSQVIGVLGVVHATRTDAFNAAAIALLTEAGRQAGLLVDAALLSAHYQEMTRKINLINVAIQPIMFSGDRLEGLETACQTACGVSGADKAAIFLNVGPGIDLQMAVGVSDMFREWIEVNPPAMHEELLRVPDVRNHPNIVLQEAGRVGEFRGLIEMPLRSGRVIQGMLALYFDAPNAFDLRSHQIDLLIPLAGQIAALLENTRLVDVMEQYVFEIGQLVQLSRISTASLNLSVVAHDIADMLQQMTNSSRVALVALEAERVRLLAAANGSTASTTDRLEPFPELIELGRDSSPMPRALQFDDPGLSPEMAEHLAAYREKTLILVPMIVDSVVMGILMLGSHETRQFDMRESQFVEMAANQIATQINNIWLHEKIQQELNRRLAQVAVVEDIAQQVSSSLDFNQIINHVLEAALQATDADLVLLALVTDTGQVWVIEQRIENGQAHWRYFSRGNQVGLTGFVLSQGRPVVIADNQQMNFYESDYDSRYRSSLGVPLVKDSEILGVLAVESKQSGAFNQEHAGFMTSLAGHAVMSIENAHFLDERRDEIELLRNLRDLSLWLVSADDIRSVGFEILETALQLFQGKQAVLYAYETGTLRMLTRLWYSELSNPVAEETLPAVLAQAAATTGELVHVVDVQAHPAYHGDFDYGSVVAVPLKRAQQVGYILVVTFDGHRELIDRDLNTIELLAGQAIGHLENASLHERIRAGRDQMRAILNSTRDGLILLDCDARLIESNPAAYRLLGVDLSEEEHAFFPELLQSSDVTDEAGNQANESDDLMMTLRTQPEAETRRQLRRRLDGQVVYIEELGLPVMGEGDEIIGRLLVLRDVTEDHLLEEQREDLADMVVHDFRGPLGAIQNAVDLVLPQLGDPADEADNRMLLSMARDNASRLLSLAEVLLDISRMERPGLELKREAVTLESLVATGLASVSTTAQRADISLEADLPADLPQIYVDPEKIERVIINLLDNAVRYTPPGGRILVTAAVQDADWVEVRIADSGPGIPRERRDNVFERFRRIPGQEPLRGQKGHGLGLNFVKLAVENHGGTIRIVDGCVLSGACFALTLPILES